MKGRKPKDLELKILQGNPGRRPLEGNAAAFVVSTPEKPSDLDTFASKEWDRLVESLAPVLCSASVGTLLVACDAYADMMHANAVLREQGATYTTVGESGSVLVRQRPEVRMKENARRSYQLALSELGASPVGQTRVRPLPAPSECTGVKRLLG
ncbi:MAG: P27 family phage terminase small subunit [Nitrospira sp. CG24E]|nr:MAG: P27 family phage terminase small subunit [Nitrospira sp. CG24E]